LVIFFEVIFAVICSLGVARIIVELETNYVNPSNRYTKRFGVLFLFH